MSAASYETRAHYHWRWAFKYSATSIYCFAASLWLWPSRAGVMVLAVGYLFTWMSYRARQRARQVLP